MFQFGPLPEPVEFNQDARIAEARDGIENYYTGLVDHKDENGKDPTFPKKINRRDVDHWGKFKGDFSAKQHGRCGYCEARVIGSQNGDVEHFYPKAEVHILDPHNPGREADHLSNVSGRKSLRVISTGYWWKALEWDNYLLSCTVCNSKWKKNFFPVEPADQTLEDRARPARNIQEVPLLLNPLSEEDPADHLAYELEGTIHGQTEMGLATIQTCGLWRPSLVSARRPILRKLKRRFDEMMTSPSDEVVRIHAQDTFEEGQPYWPTFPGLTRIFFRQATGMNWSELEQLVD